MLVVAVAALSLAGAIMALTMLLRDISIWWTTRPKGNSTTD
jgi:hypothetical protein